MNLIDARVIEILSPVYTQYGKWWVRVAYDAWGRIDEKALMFSTQDEASSVKVGYEFLT